LSFQGDNHRFGKLIRANVILANKWGLHAKTAFMLAKTAMRFESDIIVRKNETRADGKHMDQLLALCVSSGDMIDIIAEGSDEDEAVGELKRLVESGFGEK